MALAFSVVLATPATAAEDPQSLLRNAILAPRFLSYVGQIETLRFGDSRASATIERIEHRAPSLTRRSFLAPRTLYGNYRISTGQTTYDVDLKQATVTVGHEPDVGQDPVPDATLALVLANYRAVVGPSETTAGRTTRSITLINRFSGERTLRLWIDDHTHLILKREAYDADGSIVSVTRFEELRYTDDIPPELFETPAPKGYQTVSGVDVSSPDSNVERVEQSTGFAAKSPSYLPEGFRLVAAAIDGIGQKHTLHLFYSDGLRNLSLFESSKLAADFRALSSHPTKVGVYAARYAEEGTTTLVGWKGKTLHFVIVGNLPKNELTKIAQSIDP